MKKFSLIVVMLMACGGTSPLVPVPQEQEDVGSPPEVVVDNELDVIVVFDKDLPEEVENAAPDLPGNGENNPRCDAGRGKKLGLIKHGKCP